jgi:hypothetical protein
LQVKHTQNWAGLFPSLWATTTTSFLEHV